MAASHFLEFQPDYFFFIGKQDGAGYSLNTLQSCTCSLSTGNSVGTMLATFADPHHQILGLGGDNSTSLAPHAMDIVQLRLRNRHGHWGVAWTGYIDAVHRVFDPNQGDIVQIAATSPMKLWEIVRQTPGDVVAFGQAQAAGVTGGAILKYSATAVGFPLNRLFIDPAAESGSFLWGQVNLANFTNPDMQTWSAVIGSLMSDTGLEFFFTEGGDAVWRQIGYLRPDAHVRRVEEYDLLHADLAETDQGVVTEVEVRYTNIPTFQQAAYWSAPDAMSQHLKKRHLVVYAPWINQNAAAAAYLATTLGQMYAANVLVGSVTIPADPLYRVGNLVDVPVLSPQGSFGRYYTSAVTYQLEWNGPWTMMLGLSYGRSQDESFPYSGSYSYPLLTKDVLAGFNKPQDTIGLQGPYNLRIDTSLAPNQIKLDATGLNIAAGSIVSVHDAQTAMLLGVSVNGEYVVVDGGAGYAGAALSGNIGSGSGSLLVVSYGAAPAGYNLDNQSGASGAGGVQGANVDGSGGTSDIKGVAVQWPMNAPHITQSYGDSTANEFPYTTRDMVYHGNFHNGLDMVSNDGGEVPIFAVADGVVYQVPPFDVHGFGNYMLIKHADAFISLYGHMQNGSIRVAAGDKVSRGAPIGLMGSTGNSTGAHLHLGFKINGAPAKNGQTWFWENPEDYLPPIPSGNASVAVTKPTPQPIPPGGPAPANLNQVFYNYAKALEATIPPIHWKVFYCWCVQEGDPGQRVNNPLNMLWDNLQNPDQTGGPGNPLGDFKLDAGWTPDHRRYSIVSGYPDLQSGMTATYNFLNHDQYAPIFAAATTASTTSHDAQATLAAIENSPFGTKGLQATWTTIFGASYSLL